jgi:hypothetical protein
MITDVHVTAGRSAVDGVVAPAGTACGFGARGVDRGGGKGDKDRMTVLPAVLRERMEVLFEETELCLREH